MYVVKTKDTVQLYSYRVADLHFCFCTIKMQDFSWHRSCDVFEDRFPHNVVHLWEEQLMNIVIHAC